MTEPLKGAALQLSKFFGACLGCDAEEHADALLSAVIAEAKAEEREACLEDIAAEDKLSAERDCDDEVRLVRLIRARIRRRGNQ